MIKNQSTIKPASNADHEIDLIELIKTIWAGRKIILVFVLCSTMIGMVIAALSPMEYTVSVVIVPQQDSGDAQSKLGGMSGLGGLAALAGIDININSGNELSPIVYPQIVGSVPFQLELMNTPLNFQDYTTPTSFIEYTRNKRSSGLSILSKYTIGLPGLIVKTIIKAIKGKPKDLVYLNEPSNPIIKLSEDQYLVKLLLDDLVTLDLNVKEGYITLTVKMPEPLAAAQLASKAQTLLQDYITKFKIEKVKADLDFIQERYNENKSEFEKAQVNLAIITDRNKNVTSELSQIEVARAQTRNDIALNVFQELSKQLEQAKIQVKKETPVFTTVEPVTIPSEKSKPKRFLIILIWILLGGMAGVGILFGKEYYSGLSKELKES